MYESNIVKKLLSRQLKGDSNLKFQRGTHVTLDCIEKLGLEEELKGHQGCVNCLTWNEDGSLLMSGSDDLNLIIWRALIYKAVATINTGHRGNIFSAKFMPHSGDSIVVSGAADNEIRVHEVSRKETFHVLHHHSNRVKRIATSGDHPHMFWSASEDGTVMQFDLRDRECFRSENPRCLLVDLSGQVGMTMEVKCLSINPAFPEMLAVGANDPFARVYDRRMLQCTSLRADRSSPTDLPKGCVQYYVPGHLPKKQSDYKRLMRTLACTYLTFSPDGRELLVNLGGEHIYLYDVHNERRSQKLESVLRNVKQTPRAADCNGFKQPVHIQPTNGFSHGLVSSKNNKANKTSSTLNNGDETTPEDSSSESRPLNKVEEIRIRANELFSRQKYNMSIYEYNLAIALEPSSILYCNRALALSKRNWDGDVYAAMRDSLSAIRLDDNNLKAHFRLAKCFLELSWLDEAKSCLEIFQQKFSHSNSFNSLEVEIKNAIKNKKSSDDSSSSSSPPPASSTFRPREFASSDKISDDEKRYRDLSCDYEQRFCGHCNTTTDIKEANFFGSNGDFIVAGSDDGHFFVWDKKSSNVVNVILGDSNIVNCLEPHPTCCLLATSGIENVVRLWSPRPDNKQILKDKELVDIDEVSKANQQRMNKDPLEQMLVNMGYRISSPDPDARGDFDLESPITCRTS